MSTTRHPSSTTAEKHQSFDIFLGALLEKALEAYPATEAKDGMAGLWLASSAVIGLHRLTQLLPHFSSLQQQTESIALASTSSSDALPGPTREAQVSSWLHSFSTGWRLNTEGEERQQQLVQLLEQTEENFQVLQSDFEQDILDTEELIIEVDALFTQTLYMVSWLQRPS